MRGGGNAHEGHCLSAREGYGGGRGDGHDGMYFSGGSPFSEVHSTTHHRPSTAGSVQQPCSSSPCPAAPTFSPASSQAGLQQGWPQPRHLPRGLLTSPGAASDTQSALSGLMHAILDKPLPGNVRQVPGGLGPRDTGAATLSSGFGAPHPAAQPQPQHPQLAGRLPPAQQQVNLGAANTAGAAAVGGVPHPSLPRCARCGLTEDESPGACTFHPALLPDPGPLRFTPEWFACKMGCGAQPGAPGCYTRRGHFFPGVLLRAMERAAGAMGGMREEQQQQVQQLQQQQVHVLQQQRQRGNEGCGAGVHGGNADGGGAGGGSGVERREVGRGGGSRGRGRGASSPSPSPRPRSRTLPQPQPQR